MFSCLVGVSNGGCVRQGFATQYDALQSDGGGADQSDQDVLILPAEYLVDQRHQGCASALAVATPEAATVRSTVVKINATQATLRAGDACCAGAQAVMLELVDRPRFISLAVGDQPLRLSIRTVCDEEQTCAVAAAQDILSLQQLQRQNGIRFVVICPLDARSIPAQLTLSW